MTWKWKALMQHAFSISPSGENLNYLCQRYVTRKLPMSDAEFAIRVAGAKLHIDLLQKYSSMPIADSTFYEFGAGWDLIPPLSFFACGVQRQLIVDIRPLLKLDLLNETIRKFQRVEFCVPLMRKPDRFLEARADSIQLLKDYYGIEYTAPCDARNTKLEAGSVDFVTSTNTLEHIPRHDIESILRECHRLLRCDGVMSFRTDYQDHYSYFDSTISVYNFLQYSDKAWSLFNPSLNYQNRMRHRDYLEIFRKCGFEVLEEKLKLGSAADVGTVERLPLASRFSGYTPDELAVRGSTVVLRKRETACATTSLYDERGKRLNDR
jgi:SAM-dependent methyltransferase